MRMITLFKHEQKILTNYSLPDYHLLRAHLYQQTTQR